ncbi:MAG: cobalt-precorrin-5B (C(1))-methyltransferase CbiD [Actinomycetota bacterium]|nr:cobalt-precorrin-5B (C(1))-methyltransferase CbiD [Actinomycetota bacterium]
MTGEKRKRTLRSGFTTGACAAAAAKGAVLFMAGKRPRSVEIPMPEASGMKRAKFKLLGGRDADGAWAAVIKDAGDDPDVTNGAEIKALARPGAAEDILIKGGEGVGTVTRPGLSVPVGAPAITPVPLRMITEAAREARAEAGVEAGVEIIVTVPEGRRLAEKTLNSRLGVVGGISILGTTGIVKPLSGEAWKATIKSSLNVAQASGLKEVVLSAGRTSEAAHMKDKKLAMPETAYVLMGDYVEFSLKEAGAGGFKRIHLCAQWAKMLKIAMGTPDTHVRAGALNINKAVEFLDNLGIALPERDYNTAREIMDFIKKPGGLKKVCAAAARYARKISGAGGVSTWLVSYEGEIIAGSN